MQIHELPAQSTTNNSDELAIDTGLTTQRVNVEALGKKITEDAAPAFTSEDASDPSSWTDVTALSSGTAMKTVLNKISTMFKNIRYLYKMLGTADISAIDNGTVTGAISKLNTDLTADTGIGKIVYGTHNDLSVSVPSGTATEVNTLTLATGRWLIVATIDWSANATGYRQLAFADGVNPARFIASTVMAMTTGGKQTYQQLVRLVASTGETFTVYGLQNSGTSLTTYPHIFAIKIGR